MGGTAAADRCAAHRVCETERGDGAAASEGGGVVPGTGPSHRGEDPAGAPTGALLRQPGRCASAGASVGRTYARGAARGGICAGGDRRTGGEEGGRGGV